MFMFEEWIKKVYLKKCLNGVRPKEEEEEERKDLEIRGCRK